MSYLRPLNFQPPRLEALAQESWLIHVIRLIKNHLILNRIAEGSNEILSFRFQLLDEYLDRYLPISLQENTFHRGTQILRKELTCNVDLFPPFFQMFWRTNFRWLNLPQLCNSEDRIAILEFLNSFEVPGGSFQTENAKFRLFDRSSLNIQESYLMKRTLRLLSSMKHCVLWKSCDDTMLNIIGRTCFHLEALDLWRSLNVTDKGIENLLALKVPNNLRRIVVKDTSVTAIGILEIVLKCLKLEIMDMNQSGDLVQQFFSGIRGMKRPLTLKSLFFPVIQGNENVKEIIQMFPKLEDLTIWTASPYLKSFERLELGHLHSLKLGGLHSSTVLTDLIMSVGHQLTALKIETMHAHVNLNVIGEWCPNLEEFHVINARIITSGDHCCSKVKSHFLKLKLIYFFLVQYNNEFMPPTLLDCPKSALHCLLSHVLNLEGIQATGSQDLTDEFLESLLKVNPFKKLKRFMLTSPFTFSSDPPQVPLILTSASVIRLAEACPKLHCIGDLRHWNINPSERKILLKRAQGWISNSECRNNIVVV